MTKELTRAQKYKARSETRETEIVEVTVPSGDIFLFKKPSRFGMLFGMGNMPMSAASLAVESWKKEGILGAEGNEAAEEQDTLKIFEVAIRIRDHVLRLSHSPKLVMGIADETKDELSTDDVSNDDLEYLLAWVKSGGDESGALLATFSRRSQSGPVAKPNRSSRRAKAKSTRRNK